MNIFVQIFLIKVEVYMARVLLTKLGLSISCLELEGTLTILAVTPSVAEVMVWSFPNWEFWVGPVVEEQLWFHELHSILWFSALIKWSLVETMYWYLEISMHGPTLWQRPYWRRVCSGRHLRSWTSFCIFRFWLLYPLSMPLPWVWREGSGRIASVTATVETCDCI